MFVPFLVVALMWEYYVFCSCSTLFPLGILFCLTRESSAKGATTIIDNENEELDVSILQTCQAQHISYNVIAQSRNRQPNNVLELNKCSQELDHSKESVTLLTPTLLSPIYISYTIRSVLSDSVTYILQYFVFRRLGRAKYGSSNSFLCDSKENIRIGQPIC